MPPRTIVVSPAAAPGPSLSFVLPPAVELSLQSVLAEVDASAAGDVAATLTVADSSGAVIARMRQGEAVSGGAPGSATWALRLADDASGAGGLETTDGAFNTIDPTTILRTVGGLDLFPSGSTAVLRTKPAAVHIAAHWNGAFNTTGAPRPLVVDEAAGMSLFTATQIRIPEDGYYVTLLDGAVAQPGPVPAGSRLAIRAQGQVYLESIEANIPPDAPLLAGQNANRRMSAVGLRFYPGSELVQVFAENGGGGGIPNTSTNGGRIAMYRLF